MLSNNKKILEDAYYHRYAVGGFNASNLEVVMAIIEKSAQLKSPAIVETSKKEMNHGGAEAMAAVVRKAAAKYNIPVSIHLDHGDNLETVKQAIDAGYTSVHFDGSGLPFEENVEQTRKVVAFAHKHGVSVEGEVGKVLTPSFKGQDENRENFFTKPEEAKIFVHLTKVDSLAIAIGTSHGAYKGKAMLDIDRLKLINRAAGVPLVLHGGSMCPEQQLKKAIFYGVAKVNINTELRIAFAQAIKECFDKNPEEIVPYVYLGPAKEKVAQVVEEKIRQFKSNGRA